MNGFLKATLTREKFRGLFVNTALGNFAGYVAGSLVTLASTRHVVERRGLSNFFGILPRKKLVVHVLPHWLEWLLALMVGFLVMEAVRYWVNHRKYAALLSALQPAPVAGNLVGANLAEQTVSRGSAAHRQVAQQQNEQAARGETGAGVDEKTAADSAPRVAPAIDHDHIRVGDV